jgi:integrase/recombinase XerD
MADVSRVTGPLGPFAAGFVDHLSRQGIKPKTVGRHVALVAGLSEWLTAEGVAPSGLSSEVAERYAAARRAAGHSNRLTIKALEPLLGYLRGLGPTRWWDTLPGPLTWLLRVRALR